MNFKKVIFAAAVAMSSLSLSAQVYTPGGAANSTAGSVFPSTSIGINNGGNNKGTLHIGERLSIDTEHWSKTVDLQYNMYRDGSNYKAISTNTVQWSGVGRFSLHNYGFSFMGVTHQAVQGSTVPTQTEIMRINHNGTVGINIANAKAKLHVNGTSLIGDGTFTQNKTNASGAAYRLYVKGGIITEELKVELAAGNWADYVFADDYDLKTLEEVEATIQEKGHLHNINSAEKIEEEGLELKSMTINQQEKIEEIFLHMIEMNKQITKLNQQVQALKLENAQLKTQVQKPSK